MKWFLKKSESTARSFREYNTVYKREQNSKLFAYCSQTVKSSRTIVFRTEVESRTQGSRPRPTTQKNPKPRPRTAFPRTAFPRTDPLEAKDKNARGQGPRTQPQVFSKKNRFSKKFFMLSPIHRLTQNF